MKNTKFISGLLFIVSFSFDCGKSFDLEDYVNDQLEKRNGREAVFFINNKPYAASQFRKEMLYNRRHFQNKFDYPAPDGLKSDLEEYIQETILLHSALRDVDLNSSEVRSFIWPFLKKAIIAYYLEKKSGSYELVEDYDNIKIDDDIIDKYIAMKNPSQKEKEEYKAKLKNTAIYIKWKKMYEHSATNKQKIIADLKNANVVKLNSSEIFKAE